MGEGGLRKRKRVNPWGKKLKHGLAWEKKLRPKLEEALHTSPTLRFFFSKVSPSEDLSSDAEIRCEPPNIDFKTREPQYHRLNPDILIELKTGWKLGWFYTTNSIIYYAWERYTEKTPEHNCLIAGFFIDIPKLRVEYPEWIEQIIKKYYRKKSEAVSERNGGKRWSTKNVFVPVREFPKATILPFNLDPEPVKQQAKTGGWT